MARRCVAAVFATMAVAPMRTCTDVRYIDPSDNRGAGAVMGNALEDDCEDQPFRFRITG